MVAVRPTMAGGQRYRRRISFSQGAEWNALISTYIGTIPLSGDTPCAAEHIMSASPPATQVSSAMTANVGGRKAEPTSRAERRRIAAAPGFVSSDYHRAARS